MLVWLLERNRPSGDMSAPADGASEAEVAAFKPEPINPITEYLAVDGGLFRWTKDANEAVRFARADDANAFKGPITAPFTDVTQANEHGFD